MRIIIAFLMLSGFLLSQPLTKDTIDNTTKISEEIPAVVKPSVEEIVTNSEEAKKASSDLAKEMKKQIEIIRQIKKKATALKNTTEVKKVLLKPAGDDKKVVYLNAIKPDTVKVQFKGQPIKYEYREKTLFGIVFFSGYYPYIIGENNKKVYIK